MQVDAVACQKNHGRIDSLLETPRRAESWQLQMAVHLQSRAIVVDQRHNIDNSHLLNK